MQLSTAAAAVAALAALARRYYRAARTLAIAQVTLVLLGWGAAQYPLLIAPDLAIREAAAPAATLGLLFPTVLGGSLILFPSLYWMLRVFKSARS